MSRIACVVWADLAGDSAVSTEYEDKHIPNVVTKLGCTARNAQQAEDNMFKEVASIDGSLMTLYDLPDGVDAKDAITQKQLDEAKLPKDARIDTRVYDEYATWFGEEWCERKADPSADFLSLKLTAVAL